MMIKKRKEIPIKLFKLKYLQDGRRVEILTICIVCMCACDNDMIKKTNSYQTFQSQLLTLKYLQDGRRVARPQSVADMEELGRDLENMQIVNSRLVAEYL